MFINILNFEKFSIMIEILVILVAFCCLDFWIFYSKNMNLYMLHHFLCSRVDCFNQWQIRAFERNGLNLTSTKREEVQRLRARIDDLSLRYIRNMIDESTFLLFSETELAGLPPELLQVVQFFCLLLLWIISYFIYFCYTLYVFPFWDSR